MQNLRDEYESSYSIDPHKSKENFILQQHKKMVEIFELLQSLIEDSDIENLIVSKDKVIANLNRPNISIELNPNDARSCALETLNFKRYESHDSSIIYGIFDFLCYAKAYTPIFFDVGANEGIYTISALKRKKALEVHAFEAVPEIAERLKENLIVNEASLDYLNNVAVSDKISRVDFTYVSKVSGSSSFKNLLDHESARTMKVKTITLDSYCNSLKINPDFVKIDVEGAEQLVIDGFRKTLEAQQSKPIMFIEILRKWSAHYGTNATVLYQEICSLGYQGYTLDSDNILRKCNSISEETKSTNFLFLPENFIYFEDLEKFISRY